jgi:dimethylhistidine N-methyltransferase
VRTDSKDTLMTESRFTLDDRLPAGYFTESLRADVLAGLGGTPRTLPPKWFYDKRGSDLFEQITRLPEYYPTRAEQEILEQRAPEIAELTKAATLVELGSGSSRKTRLLLDALTAAGTLGTYTPIDVSESALEAAGRALVETYPGLAVRALVADFQGELALPETGGPRLVAFLGGTIGNLYPGPRRDFLARVAAMLGPGDRLLLGTDLVKERARLEAAYDDAGGVTAEFNKNVLLVLNRELGADFDLDAFEHVARYDGEEARMDIRLRSLVDQTVRVEAVDLTVSFAAGEEMQTEISAKFTRERLERVYEEAGLALCGWFTDRADDYALSLAEAL